MAALRSVPVASASAVRAAVRWVAIRLRSGYVGADDGDQAGGDAPFQLWNRPPIASSEGRRVTGLSGGEMEGQVRFPRDAGSR
ncbi:hypothetical protein ACFVRD_35305 [Streptomyces sp. NPDC057908]|uniref:hypothetical protein n=1 Tax=Streptomyces sp. NPDC057908 TaxID=3346276 RepID=UPI0036E1C974